MNLQPKPDTIFDATVGTAVAQLTTTAYQANAGIDVRAVAANTVNVYVGLSTSMTTTASWELAPGESKRFLTKDPSQLYTLAGSASQHVRVSVE
jgi:hypothetical protein